MEVDLLKIKLISYTYNPIETIYRAYRTCYSKNIPTEIKIPNTEQEMINFIKKYIQHESPLEHVGFTFSIEGVSRSLLAQLTRHRLASYSVQSQRYVSSGDFEYVIPQSIKDKGWEDRYIMHMKYISNIYKEMTKEGIPKEDARYILPNATTTNVVMTMNLREFRHFYAERSCKRAQWEIRELAELLMNEVKQVIPFADYKVKKCGVTCFDCQNIKP
jgi:thymidylate synthase (FAD)